MGKSIVRLGLMLALGLLIGWLVFGHRAAKEHVDAAEQGKESTYTCSMHPQIRQTGPGKCPICGMELVPVTKTGGHEGHDDPFVHTMSPEAVALANIRTRKVRAVSPEHEIRLTGKVALNEQRLAVITANFPGRIEELFIDFTGQTVTEGQRMATIYSPELVTAQKELIEASKSKESNRALYDAVREKLRLWKISPRQIDDIEQGASVLTAYDVYADMAGVVMRREVSKGDYVGRGDVLLEVADLSNVWVILDAYESDLPLMRVGQKIRFTLTSVPGTEFTSTIAFIDPLIDPRTRTASVRAEAANPGLVLKPGMFVNAKVKAHFPLREKALVIPNTALLWTGKRSVVYVKVPDSEFPAFEMREIVTGPSLGEYHAVAEGLTEGEEVVVNGVFAIDAAAQLNGNYSMMNRPVDRRIPVPGKFTAQLTAFLDLYLTLTDHLVASDHAKAKESAGRLLQAFGHIDHDQLDGAALTAWTGHRAILRKHLDRLAEAGSLERQREIVAPLSAQLRETLEVFGPGNRDIFVIFCPMALDNSGAHWLSVSQEVRNPYFGEAMLKCGNVKGSITPKGARPGKAPKDSPQAGGHQH